MNIISFLMPTAKSADAGAKSQAPADAQAGTGFAAMLAQVLGSLGVPVRPESPAAPGTKPSATLESDAGTTDASSENHATTSPTSGHAVAVNGETTEPDGLDVFLIRRAPQRGVEGTEELDAPITLTRTLDGGSGSNKAASPALVVPDSSSSALAGKAVEQAASGVAGATPATAPISSGHDAESSVTSESETTDTVHRLTDQPVPAADAAAAAGASGTSLESQANARASEATPIAPSSRPETHVPQDARGSNDRLRPGSRAATAASTLAVGSHLPDPNRSHRADQHFGNSDRPPLADAQVQSARPESSGSMIPEPGRTVTPPDEEIRRRPESGPSTRSAPASTRPGHTIESMMLGSASDASTARQTPGTPNAIAEKLMQMIVEPPVQSRAQATEVRGPAPPAETPSAPVPVEHVRTGRRSTESESDTVASGRSEVTSPRVMPMVEPPLPRMMNAPSGSGEAAMTRETPELPQQPEAAKGAFDSVSLHVKNADGTPTRIRVAVRGDEVRTTIIESETGAAQRMASRGDELQQSLAARGFSKTTLSVHGPAGRAPDVAASTPVHVDRADSASSSDGRGDRDGDRASQRDQTHGRPDTDRDQSRSRQRSRRERER